MDSTPASCAAGKDPGPKRLRRALVPKHLLGLLAFLFVLPAVSAHAITTVADEDPVYLEVARSPVSDVQTKLVESTYQSYDSAKIALANLMRASTSRVILVTRKLGDGELATLVHSLKLKGRQTIVVLDRKATSFYKSRHVYLSKAEVPVYFTSLGTVAPPGRSLVVVDDTALEIGADLDGQTKGAVYIRASRYTPEELVQAINSRGPLERSLRTTSPTGTQTESADRDSGAKPSTSTAGAARTKGDSIASGVKLRARGLPRDNRAIPKTLPRKTIMGEISAGSRGADEPVVPVRSVREEYLRLDNEGDLRAD